MRRNMKEKLITKRELLKKLKFLDLKNEAREKFVACSLLGHSNITEYFFGRHYCGRCGVEVSNSRNFKKATWRDKFMVPDSLCNRKGGNRK